MKVSPEPILSNSPESYFTAKYTVSVTTSKVIELSPSLIFGAYNLFSYDCSTREMGLSRTFKKLLTLLVELEQIDRQVLKATSFEKLNEIFQKFQGLNGGLLREAGVERWHLKDFSIHQKHREKMESLFQKLGFRGVCENTAVKKLNHCILFGADVWSMENRILKTLEILKNPVEIKDKIFLLGSNRQLGKDESAYLKKKINTLATKDTSKWQNFFKQKQLLTEANAFSSDIEQFAKLIF